ncbi:MAG: hypothetical protein R3F33_11155 [Planctomycetota bacterium]
MSIKDENEFQIYLKACLVEALESWSKSKSEGRHDQSTPVSVHSGRACARIRS